MYPVSLDYQNKIKENDRLFESIIQIQHSTGVLNLSDKDLAVGTLTYTESSQAGEEFTIGSTVASDISFTILNKPEYENITFMGSTVTCSIGLQVKEGMDAHFMQPSQPSKMPRFEEKWEYVPLGRFTIDDVNRQRNTIGLKAIDSMIKLDIPYSLSKLSYPANLYQIYVNICNVADVPIGTTDFPNKNYIVNTRLDGDLTLRDVLGYIAELAGCFARCSRNGVLELLWYKSTGLTLGPSNRFDFKPSDDEVKIKGIMASTEDTTYLAGSEDYAIDLTENPLLQGGYETVLRNIYNNVKDTVFTPYTSNWQGNPALQAGDMITQIDRDGKEYNTLVTKSVYKYRGRSTLEAKGLPEISKGYKGDVSRRIAQIRRKIEEEVGDKITDLEQAMLEATEFITGQLGGYVLKRENELLIMDNPDPDKAVKIWRWNLGGLGYSNTGIDGPYGLAMTMNGAINANFITTGLLSANIVKTGILQSEDGKLSLNLNNASFSFENGVVQFTPQGLKVFHSGSNQYSELRNDGLKRQWPYGEASYLNDMWLGEFSYAGRPSPNKPSNTIVTLPERFRGRGNAVEIVLSLNDLRLRIGSATDMDRLSWITVDSGTVLRVVNSNFNLTNPQIEVEAYVNNVWIGRENDWYKEDSYQRLGFTVIVIGE